MLNTKNIIVTICVLAVWAYTVTVATDYIINRPVHSFVQMLTSLLILAYSFVCFHFIYKLLTKTQK